MKKRKKKEKQSIKKKNKKTFISQGGCRWERINFFWIKVLSVTKVQKCHKIMATKCEEHPKAGFFS